MSQLAIKHSAGLRSGVAITAILSVLGWSFFRMSEVRPAILGDEWVYTMSSRHGELWGTTQDPLGNYLFNLIYSTTWLCGSDFYFCGKLLNLVFFGAFLTVLLLLALRYLSFFVSVCLVVAFGLSPLSVYISMYLPESLYFSLMGLTALFLSHAIASDKPVNWAYSGLALGMAALTKPHALISLIPLAIFVLIYSVEKKGTRDFLVRVGSALGGFLVARFLIGFVVAGPKAINVLGTYGLGDALATATRVAEVSPSQSADSVVGAGPITGVVSLFADQSWVHTQVLVALLGLPVAILIWSSLSVLQKRRATDGQRFALLAFIWIVAMTIAIVAFTGWITGSGDDHTLRVLLRYYDFLFPIVVIGALAALSNEGLATSRPWTRWVSASLVVAVASPAFTGAFGALQIQIADAPNLAGLVVNRFVFDSISIMLVIGLAVVAFFPGVVRYATLIVAAWTLIATGFQAQGQYIQFRGQDQAADTAGKILYDLRDSIPLEDVLVIANSRFDARVASLWMDSDNPILLLNPGAIVPTNAEQLVEYALILGDVSLEGDFDVLLGGDGYQFVRIED